MNTERILIGVVGVDSGQVMICDPAYIDSEWQKPDSGSYDDFGHDVYRHKEDGSLWQYTYGGKKPQGGVNKFPGSYEEIIPKYGKSPNELRELGEFILAEDVDPTPHIPKGEFSYRGVCKTNNPMFGQLKYTLGHEGVAVAASSGLGDGLYNVYAEIVDTQFWGKRVKALTIEFITDEQLKEI